MFSLCEMCLHLDSTKECWMRAGWCVWRAIQFKLGGVQCLDAVWIMTVRSTVRQAARSGWTVTVVTRTRASGWCTVSWVVVTARSSSTFALGSRWIGWSFWATIWIIWIACCWIWWSVWIRILLLSRTWIGCVWYVIVTWSL